MKQRVALVTGGGRGIRPDDEEEAERLVHCVATLAQK